MRCYLSFTGNYKTKHIDIQHTKSNTLCSRRYNTTLFVTVICHHSTYNANTMFECRRNDCSVNLLRTGFKRYTLWRQRLSNVPFFSLILSFIEKLIFKVETLTATSLLKVKLWTVTIEPSVTTPQSCSRYLLLLHLRLLW